MSSRPIRLTNVSMITIQEKYVDELYLREYIPEQYLFSKNIVLFLHGYPGSQKNYDIAEHLALKGFHCFVMHYRGAWRSQGKYSLVSIYKDVNLILDHLKERGFDRDHISLVGASWGGFVALEILAQNPNLKKGVLLAPFINMGNDEKTLLAGAEFLYSITKPSIKNYEKEELISDLKTVQKNYNPISKLSEIDGKNVLIIHGTNDNICPIENSVKLKSLFKTDARFYRLEGQDHFLNTREMLFDFCYMFLKE